MLGAVAIRFPCGSICYSCPAYTFLRNIFPCHPNVPFQFQPVAQPASRRAVPLHASLLRPNPFVFAVDHHVAGLPEQKPKTTA